LFTILAAGLAAVSTAGRESPATAGAVSVLRAIASMVNRSGDPDAFVDNALQKIMRFLGMDAGMLRLNITAETCPHAVSSGFGPELVSILESDGDATIPAAAGISEWPDGVLFENLKKERFRFFINYPVRSGDRVLGSLVLASRRKKTFKKTEEAFLAAVTEILGTADIIAKLKEQSNKLSEDLVALQEVNKIISQGFNLEDIIQRIVVEGKRLAKTSQCHLFLLDDQSRCLIGSASTQSDSLDIRTFKISFSDASTAVTALVERRVIAVEDIPRNARSKSELMETLGWRAAIFAPLLTKEQAIGVLVCSDDSRERRFAEEEILRAEALAHQAAIALENARLFQVVSRSQKSWETTFDAMQDCVSVHDTTGKVIRANVALAKRLGTIPQKIIGRFCSEIYNPSGTGASPCLHTLPLKSKTLVVEETTLPAMGGVFQISVSPWYDKNNRLAGSIHVAKDINNEKLLQQQLIQSEKLSAIGELISGIAHELNNPLTGVMGYSQLLQLRKDLDDRAKENLHKINNLALRCQKIVQNLLSFARKQKPERTLS
ncbi:MAG TPA: GAF domain-containing protein, partial [Acidobacteriota bacterium]|nr:GAF domain-containing protein [Acidobacteriota bacterium]